MAVEIRKATMDDATAVAPLLDQLGYPSTTGEVRARLSTILQRADYRTWVAELDGRVVGFAGACIGYHYEKNEPYVRLLVLVTDEACRGSGAGRRLAETAEAWANECGAGSIIVNSALHRHAAHRFYEHLGFEHTGVRLVKRLQ